jgi:hypothetical protein
VIEKVALTKFWNTGLIQARQTNTSASLSGATTFGIGAIAGVITV